MKFKFSKLAIGLAAVVAFSGQAMANTTTSLGALSVPSNLTIGDPSTSGGFFTDLFTFSIPNASVATSLTSINLASSTISGLAVSLYEGASLVESGVSTNLGSFGWQASLPSVSLLAGNYSLDVTGTASETGGSYGGTLKVAAPVPEPTEGALLLSGLGLMGFIATRRRNQA